MVCLNVTHNQKKESACPECRDQTNKAFAHPVPENEVVISVRGGVVGVDRITPGIIVKVRDYDIEGYDVDDDELAQDENGNQYKEVIFQ